MVIIIIVIAAAAAAAAIVVVAFAGGGLHDAERNTAEGRQERLYGYKEQKRMQKATMERLSQRDQ